MGRKESRPKLSGDVGVISEVVDEIEDEGREGLGKSNCLQNLFQIILCVFLVEWVFEQVEQDHDKGSLDENILLHVCKLSFFASFLRVFQQSIRGDQDNENVYKDAYF